MVLSGFNNNRNKNYHLSLRSAKLDEYVNCSEVAETGSKFFKDIILPNSDYQTENIFNNSQSNTRIMSSSLGLKVNHIMDNEKKLNHTYSSTQSAFKRYHKSSEEEENVRKRMHLDLETSTSFNTSMPSHSSVSPSLVIDENSDCQNPDTLSNSVIEVLPGGTIEHQEHSGHSESLDLRKQQPKRMLVVHPRPRPRHSNYVIVHQLLSPQKLIKHFSPFPPKLVPFSSRASDKINQNNSFSSQQNLNSCSSGGGRVDSLTEHRKAGVLILPHQARISITNKPQTSSAVQYQFTENDAQRRIMTHNHPPQVRFVINRSSHRGHCVSFVSSPKPGRLLEYTVADIPKRNIVSWCHKRTVVSSREYQNLPSHIGHKCSVFKSGFVPVSSEFKHVYASVGKEHRTDTEALTNELSNRKQSLNFRERFSSPPNLERIQQRSPEVIINSSDDSSPLEVMADEFDSNDKIGTYFNNGEHSRRATSWSSETEMDQDVPCESEKGTSNEETDMEDENYDTDESIDVGDSYDPDPTLAMDFDIEADCDDHFYDGDEEDEKNSVSAETLTKSFGRSLSGFSMGAVITSSPTEMEEADETSSDSTKKLKSSDERKHFETKDGKSSSLLQETQSRLFKFRVKANQELRNKTSASTSKINEDKSKPYKTTKSRGVYRELGMRNIDENSEDLGEFHPNASVICKETDGKCSIKSPMVIFTESSKVLFLSDTESDDKNEMVFSFGDKAVRCRMLVVLWALLGEGRLREVGFPKEPVHRILWRTVDVCCSVAGVKSAAAVPLAPDHDCGKDMACFRDHAHRFLEVCAPTREHWKKFGWASLTVDAVVRKIYLEEILPAIRYAHTTVDIPERVRQAMEVLVALEKASVEERISRGRFILPKTPLPTDQATPRTSASDLEPTKKKRGRPAKITSKTDVGRVERVMLWRFLLNLLEDPRNKPCIHWVKREEGIFRILNTDWLARLWGRRHGNPRMTYEKMARAMRTYYRSKVLQPVPRSPNLPRKLVYKFNPAVIEKVAAAKLAAMGASSKKTHGFEPSLSTKVSS